MKRHESPTIRALVIVWLLLQPPVSGGAVLTRAPLGSWVVNGRFSTSEECESTRSMNLAALYYGESTGGTNAAELSQRGVITAARCISDEELRALLAPPSPSASAD